MTEQVPYRSTFFRLLGFLKPYKFSLVVSIVLACGSQAAQIALVWVTGGVIDNAIRPNDNDKLVVYVALIVGLGVVKAGLMVGRRLISGNQALGVEMDMRNTLYARLVRLSFRFFDTHQTGQLMSRATVDLQGVRFFLGYGLIFLFQNILVVLSVTVVLFFVQWQLALISLAIVPFLVVLAYRYSRVSHPTLRDVQQKLADVATVAQENIVGVHVVKAFAQEPAEEEKFRERSEAVFDQTLRANRQRAFYVPLIAFAPMLAQAGVLLWGAQMVQDGALSVGHFVSFNLYLAMLVMPLRSLGMWIGQAQRATASGERIFQVIDEPADVTDRPGAIALPEGPGEVRFEGVSFEYLDGRPVLRDVDLDVAAGLTVALIGHTGSGKTTLTSLVPRFYDVGAGRVTLDGHDVRDLTLTSLRHAVGVISQDPFLFSATVRENIAFGAGDLPQEAIEAVARAAQAHEFIERLPQGYETVIG
jgi:ABC-type multidrug transport system fused ATPase/permease subunit